MSEGGWLPHIEASPSERRCRSCPLSPRVQLVRTREVSDRARCESAPDELVGQGRPRRQRRSPAAGVATMRSARPTRSSSALQFPQTSATVQSPCRTYCLWNCMPALPARVTLWRGGHDGNRVSPASRSRGCCASGRRAFRAIAYASRSIRLSMLVGRRSFRLNLRLPLTRQYGFAHSHCRRTSARRPTVIVR